MNTTVRAFALTLGLLAAGALATAHAQGANQSAVQSNQASSIGQATKLDLADWRQAGFDETNAFALSQDVFGSAYQQRYAEYQRLRQLRAQAQN